MKKQFWSLALLCLPLLTLAQDLVPYRSSRGWVLYDRRTNTPEQEIYQTIRPAKGNLLFLRQNNKWAAINRKGQSVLPFRFDALEELNNGLIKAYNDDTIHLYRSNGELFSDDIYFDATSYRDSSYIVLQNAEHKYGILSLSKRVALPFQYDYAPQHLGDAYLLVGRAHNGFPQYGIVDLKFKTLLPTTYRRIQPFQEGRLLCYAADGHYDLYNNRLELIWSGKEEVLLDYGQVLLLRDGKEQSLYFLGKKLKVPVPEEVSYSEQGGFFIGQDSKTGKTIVYNKDAESFSLDKAQLQMSRSSVHYVKAVRERPNGEFYYENWLLDQQGKEVLKQHYAILTDWNDENCVIGKVEKDANGRAHEKYGVLNIKTNQFILEMKYDAIVILKDAIVAHENRTWEVFDNTGKQLGFRKYTNYGYQHELFSKQGKLYFVEREEGTFSNGEKRVLTGYINESGQEVIPCRYNHIIAITDAYRNTPPATLYVAKLQGPLKDDNTAALLDENFKPLTAFKYYSIGYYSKGYLSFTMREIKDGKTVIRTGVMTDKGKEIVPANYDLLNYVVDHGFIVTRDGKLGFVDHSGKERIPLIYQNIYPHAGYLQVYGDGKRSLASMEGKILFTPGKFDITEAGLLNGTLYKVTINNDGQGHAYGEFYMDANGKILGDD